jgi:hypothetical protein
MASFQTCSGGVTSGGRTIIPHFIQIVQQASRDETVTVSLFLSLSLSLSHTHTHTHSGDLICHVVPRKEVGSELFDNDDGNVAGGDGGNENAVQARLFVTLISM